MNQIEIVKDIAEGMIGIGGVPSNEEFYAEFDMRLRAHLNIDPRPPKKRHLFVSYHYYVNKPNLTGAKLEGHGNMWMTCKCFPSASEVTDEIIKLVVGHHGCDPELVKPVILNFIELSEDDFKAARG